HQEIADDQGPPSVVDERLGNVEYGAAFQEGVPALDAGLAFLGVERFGDGRRRRSQRFGENNKRRGSARLQASAKFAALGLPLPEKVERDDDRAVFIRDDAAAGLQLRSADPRRNDAGSVADRETNHDRSVVR